MNGKSLVFVISALTTGILLGSFCDSPLWWALPPIIAALAIFLYSIHSSRRNPFKAQETNNNASVIFLFLGLGIFNSVLQKPVISDFSKGEYFFSGTILDYTPTGNGDKLLVSLSELRPADGLTPLNLNNVKALIILRDVTTLSYGDMVQGKASLQPCETPGNFYNKEYAEFLKRKGILITGFVGTSDYSITKGGFSLNAWMFERRDQLEGSIENTRLAVGTRNFLISVLLGDKSYINSDERLYFTDAGIAHIFAVSGFHVSMISLFIILLLSLFFHGRLRRWKFLLCVPLIWFYILLVGASPSTCRAGVMISLAMSALFLERKNDPLKALGWAVVLVLLFSPLSLFDIGFQLSVICVGSLILIAAPLNFMDHRKHPQLFKLVSISLVTLCATFSTWIICAFYFHEFSLMFLPLNILAVPLLPIFICISLLFLVLNGLGLDIHFLGRLLDTAFGLLNGGAAYLSSFNAKFTQIYPNIISIFIWLIGLAALGLTLRRKKPFVRIWIPSSLLAVAIVLIIFFPKAAPSGFIIQRNTSEATIMDYNNGEETLVTMPMTGIFQSDLHDKKILTISSDNIPESCLERISDSDIILLCKGCKTLPSEIKDRLRPNCLIVTHPSMHWRYEKRILSEAEESKLSIHSLRYDGPLHFFN